MLAGTVVPTMGKITFQGTDITSLPVHRRAVLGIARSYQVVRLFEHLTCIEAAEAAIQRDLPITDWLTRSGRRRITSTAMELLEEHGLADVAGQLTTSLAHGQQKRLEIALALANPSSLVLLDEPAAGLAVHERAELASTIRSMATKRAIVIVEHDIDMVMSIADRVTVLHYGKIIAEGSSAEVRGDTMVRQVYLHASEAQHA
jgi:branched-chain amino acid transport system ATP-binding protein